jgi:uncharacterized protein YfdQ (DUF2303 family)
VATADRPTDTAEVIAAALASAEPTPIGTDGRFYVVVTPGSADPTLIDLDVEREKFAFQPRHSTAARVVYDAESFVAYLERHGRASTEIYADLDGRAITAIIDSHSEAGAGNQKHKITLSVRETTAWKAWLRISGSLMDQVKFAEHIEQRTADIVEPDGARVLEIAQTFVGQRGVEFEAGSRLSNGQIRVQWNETVKAKAGQKGDLEIPETLVLGLAPFEGAPTYRVQAALRWRVNDKALTLGVVLLDPETVLENAFADIVESVKVGAEAYPMYFGKP